MPIKNTVGNGQCDQIARLFFNNWKFAQWHTKFVKVGLKICQILNKLSKNYRKHKTLQKWQNLAKSGHTVEIGYDWQWEENICILEEAKSWLDSFLQTMDHRLQHPLSQVKSRCCEGKGCGCCCCDGRWCCITVVVVVLVGDVVLLLLLWW